MVGQELPEDPRGLIRAAYEMPTLDAQDARTIFLDWALGAEDADLRPALRVLLDFYAPHFPDHPMTGVLHAGLAPVTPRGRRKT